jgi:glycerol-3-phosphate acyltransferase PlsY
MEAKGSMQVQVLWHVLAILVGYLVGSFPTGYLVSKAWKGIDPREHASGRTGGTNVLRAAGRGPAVVTALGDVLKGAVAVLLVRRLGGPGIPEVLAGLGAVVGHNRSIFLGFNGGAGTSANMGVVLVLAPHILPYMVVTAAIAAFCTKIASVASIVAAVTMVIALVVSFSRSLSTVLHMIYGVLACGIIILELRPNIERLRSGTERRVEHL